MKTVKLISIDNSIGVALPQEVLERLKVGEGDLLSLTETPNGLLLSPIDSETRAQLKVAEEVMQADHDVLKKLS